MMIEGLKATVTSTELGEWLLKKVAEHDNKADAYQAEADKLSVIEVPSWASNDPVKGARDKSVEHRQKAQYFDFLLRHLESGAIYRLTMYELRELELIK